MHCRFRLFFVPCMETPSSYSIFTILTECVLKECYHVLTACYVDMEGFDKPGGLVVFNAVTKIEPQQGQSIRKCYFCDKQEDGRINGFAKTSYSKYRDYWGGIYEEQVVDEQGNVGIVGGPFLVECGV